MAKENLEAAAMDPGTRTVFVKLGLFLSACLALAGLVGMGAVIKMGLLPSGHPMGHSRDFDQGWRLFFLLFLGLPCLAALVGGLAPWIVWWRRLRKKQEPPSHR